MGGSAIGGDLAAAALGDRLSKPLLTVRGYELPSWAPAGSAVLCSSYSGDTEETLACYAAAEALGAQRLVATTGGKLAELGARATASRWSGLPAGAPARAPRSATCSASRPSWPRWRWPRPRIHTEIDAAAAHLEERARRDRRAGRRARATGSATRSRSSTAADLTAPVAYRWKCQVNENAKAAGLLLRPARGRPQRDRGLGRGAERGSLRLRAARGLATSTRASAGASS